MSRTKQAAPTISIAQMKARNNQAGLFWFTPDTMRFFASRIESDGFVSRDGTAAFFVTSEQFKPFDGPPAQRLFSVRKFDMETANVDTVGEFQQFKSRRTARIEAMTHAMGWEKQHGVAA